MFRNCGRAPLTVDVSVIGALVAVCIYLTVPSTRYIPSNIKDVGSLPAALTLVFFWVWHSSDQPYQVLDPESSLTVHTSLYVFARRPILAEGPHSDKHYSWGVVLVLERCSSLRLLAHSVAIRGITVTLVWWFWAALQCHARLWTLNLLNAQCSVNFLNLNTCEPNTIAQSNMISSVLYVTNPLWTNQRIDPN